MHKFGITNGCFDILHAGHIDLLRQTVGWCQKLIVAVNTDESIRRLKGPSRPINDLPYRLSMLEAIKYIHRLRTFDTEEELKEIIEVEGATILFKGHEYADCRITGDDLVQEVKLIKTRFHSSTDYEIAKRNPKGDSIWR